MVDITSIIEGTVKFRDGKKWKSRWCVMRKLSPVADCLHLQLYRDSKDRYKQGQTKASLSLQQFLGVESGFTLDKESNTIAIICQDVIVVLAFDTRERLIQWQVKISNNLGDDIQYLILVSSTPPKSKLANGPARMHVQDNRFCLTTGVPPKLTGLWDISYLRRYGVIDGRFCFEGGSRCGKGEGLYVFVTDQGDEITHTLKLASQGKLSTKRRAINRKLSALDSPRKQTLSPPRPTDILISHNNNSNLNNSQIIDENNCGHLDDSQSTTHSCICSSSNNNNTHNSNNRISYWPSQESRDLDSNYGCGDTVSVSEVNDSFNDTDHFPSRHPMSQMERCMSCMSKLGAMSRSSTATGCGTPATGQPPNWQLLNEQQNFHNLNQHGHNNNHHHHQTNCPVMMIQNNTHSHNQLPHTSTPKLISNALDRMSVCSSHGSYTSSSSEYSVPRLSCNLTQSHESWYERIENSQSPQQHQQPCNNNNRASSPCQCCPPRPPKSKSLIKPQMPLPITTPLQSNLNCTSNIKRITANSPSQFCGPYENYDIPKTPIQVDPSSTTENYDTPKKIQEYLIKDMLLKNSNNNINNNTTTTTTPGESVNIYGNYDLPSNMINMCGCLSSKKPSTTSTTKTTGNDTEKDDEERGPPRPDCTCHKVMSWADNWISIPYCRRGNSIENTGIPINKVKLSGEGKMPVVQPSGELAIYATVDLSKKVNRRLLDDSMQCDCSSTMNDDCVSGIIEIDDKQSDTSNTNYMNIMPGGIDRKDSDNQKDKNSTDGHDDASNDITLKNYMNLEFALSLENYENAKEVLQRAGFSVAAIEETLKELPQKICLKCGHTANNNKMRQRQEANHDDESTQTIEKQPSQHGKPDDYMLMEPCKKKANHPGYLRMSPAAPNNQLSPVLSTQSTSPATSHQHNPSLSLLSPTSQKPRPLPSKTELMKRIMGEKSASNPTLCGPAVDRSRKRSEQEARISGSAMMLLHKSSGSPYIRKQLMDKSDLLPVDKRLITRKRSSSADSSRFLEDGTAESFDSSETIRKSSIGGGASTAAQIIEGRRSSSPCLHQETEQLLLSEEQQFSLNEKLNVNVDTQVTAADATITPIDSITNGDGQSTTEQSNETDTDDLSQISASVQTTSHSQSSTSSTTAVYIRRSASVPCKGGEQSHHNHHHQSHQQHQNRDSSSSNDSGVSTGSARHHRPNEFTDFELPLTTAMSTRRHQRHLITQNNNHNLQHQPYNTVQYQHLHSGLNGQGPCVHASLPRRSKSFDPLREITFQFQKIMIPEKSSSAEAEIPICPPKLGHGNNTNNSGSNNNNQGNNSHNNNNGRGFASPNDQQSIVGQPYIDSRSTSSGTSDMSDYIETLSLSSHSSSDTPDGLRLIRQATSTLRPRSGKEYQNIDRSMLVLQQQQQQQQSNDGKLSTPSALQSSNTQIHGTLRGMLSCNVNYANITPVPENVESPSPGYQSGGSPQDQQQETFMFKN